jgi:cell division transport system permease protein
LSFTPGALFAMNPEVSTKPQVDKDAAGPGRLTRQARGRRPGRAIVSAEAKSVVADAVGGIRRNGLMSAAAITTIVVALLVAGAGYLMSANLGNLAVILEGQVEVVGFLRRDLSAPAKRRLVAQVESIPGVRNATIVGRADAMRRLQRTFRSMASINELLPNNPLPDSIEVGVQDARQAAKIAMALGDLPAVEEVVYGASVVDRLVALTRAVRIGGIAIAGLLVLGALLIIVNTIRLTVVARRAEIEIMSLVGATSGFIRGPFILEGALQGVGAALVASLILSAGYITLVSQLTSSLPFVPLLFGHEVLPKAVALVFGIGIIVGIAGSEIGLRRYLKA